MRCQVLHCRCIRYKVRVKSWEVAKCILISTALSMYNVSKLLSICVLNSHKQFLSLFILTFVSAFETPIPSDCCAIFQFTVCYYWHFSNVEGAHRDVDCFCGRLWGDWQKILFLRGCRSLITMANLCTNFF